MTALWAGSPQFVGALTAELDVHPELDWSSVTALFYGWGALAPGLLRRLESRCAPGLTTVGIFAGPRPSPATGPDPAAGRRRTPRPRRRWSYVGVPSGLLASDVVDEAGDPVRGEAVYRSPMMATGYYRPRTRPGRRSAAEHARLCER